LVIKIKSKYRQIASISLLMRAKRLFLNTISTILRPREKNGLCILSRQEPHTQDNGSVAFVMVLESKFGPMELGMKASGRITEPMVTENSFMLMEIFTKAIGSMTKPTATESIFMSTGQDMKDSGRMIFSMDKARKLGLMDRYMRVSIMQGKSMDSEYTVGMMAVGTRASGTKTKLEELEHTHGLMEDVIKENGLIITWKEWVYTHGKTEGDMRDNIKMIKNTDTGYILGLIIECIKECGSVENSTDSEFTLYKIKRKNAVFGKMEKESSGSILQQYRLFSVIKSILHSIFKNLRAEIMLRTIVIEMTLA
jgi:hypothetical protein